MNYLNTLDIPKLERVNERAAVGRLYSGHRLEVAGGDGRLQVGSDRHSYSGQQTNSMEVTGWSRDKIS